MSSAVPPSSPSPRICRYPGCERPAELREGRGAPRQYCDRPEHHPRSADKQRARLLAQLDPPALSTDTDPAVLLAHITQLRRELAAATAELDVERHRRHRAEHPDPPLPETGWCS